MKVSVSLPSEDIAFLDEYAKEQRLDSRSAAVQRAVRLLRTAELAAPYEAAWDEWQEADEAAIWNATTADGLKR